MRRKLVDVFPAALLIFVLFAGCILIIPNGIELRTQRMFNLCFFTLAATSIYILIRVNVLIGVLLVISCFAMTQIIDPSLEYLILTLCVIYIGITHSTSLRRYSWLLYDFIILIAALNLAWQILQCFGINILHVPAPGFETVRPGLLSNINETSALYALCFGAFLRPKRYFLIPIVILGLILSASLSGVIACAVIVIVWEFRNEYRGGNKILFYGSIASVALCVLMYADLVDHFSLEIQKKSRLSVWETTLQLAMIKPWGWGYDQYSPVVPLLTVDPHAASSENIEKMKEGVFDPKAFQEASRTIAPTNFKEIFEDAHNEYMEFLFIAGFCGLAVLFSALFVIIFKSFMIGDQVPSYGLIAAAICALFFSIWHIVPLCVLTVFYVGMTELHAAYKPIKEIKA